MLLDNRLSIGVRSQLYRLSAVGIVFLGGLFVTDLRGSAGLSQAAAAEPAAPARKAEGSTRLGYVGEISDDKRSLGGSGHAIAFHRPAEAKYLATVQIYASRYGMPPPPREDFNAYVLDKDKKVIHEFLFPYSIFTRGPQKWINLHVPPIEVPEEFFIALSFHPHQTKGIYLGLDKNVEQSHSFIGLPGEGFQPVPEKYDWMVRAVLVSDPSKVKVRKGPNVGRRVELATE